MTFPNDGTPEQAGPFVPPPPAAGLGTPASGPDIPTTPRDSSEARGPIPPPPFSQPRPHATSLPRLETSNVQALSVRYGRVAAIAAGLVVLLAVVVVIAVVWAGGGRGSHTPSPAAGRQNQVSGTASSDQASTPIARTSASTNPPATPTQRGADASSAAHQITQLLNQSHGVRHAVSDALDEVNNCSDPSAGAVGLRSAANARRALIADMNRIDVSNLAGGTNVVAALEKSLEDSARSDDQFAIWADEAPAPALTSVTRASTVRPTLPEPSTVWPPRRTRNALSRCGIHSPSGTASRSGPTPKFRGPKYQAVDCGALDGPTSICRWCYQTGGAWLAVGLAMISRRVPRSVSSQISWPAHLASNSRRGLHTSLGTSECA